MPAPAATCRVPDSGPACPACPLGDRGSGQGAWVESQGGPGVGGRAPDASATRGPPPPAQPRPLCSLVQFDCTNTPSTIRPSGERHGADGVPTEAYEVPGYVPARSLPYNQPGTCYTLVALPKEDPTAGELPGLPGARRGSG